MSGIRDDLQFSRRPGLTQLPGRAHGTDEVIASLDDHAPDIRQPMGITQQLIRRQKSPVDEIMALDACQTQGHVRIGEMGLDVGIGEQGRGTPLPDRPGVRGFQANALVLGYGRQKVLPEIGKRPVRPVLIEPADRADR
jgi:hypothetical protein